MAGTKAQETRLKLLLAARAEFCESGPDGARVDEIAKRSGVNKQRIYAYFGTKEALFGAVLGRAFDQLAEQVPIPIDREGLRRYAGEVFDFHQRDDSLIRLLAWEGLAQKGHADEEVTFDRRSYYWARTSELAARLGQEDVDFVARAVLAVVGVASWPFVVPQQRRLMIGEGGENPEGWKLLRDSVAAAGEAIVDSLLAD